MKLKFFYIYREEQVNTSGKGVYFRVAEAISNGNTERYTRYICEVLDAIAQTDDNCDSLLSFIEKVERGEDEQIVAGGNDVELTISHQGVQVDILICEDWIGQAEGLFALHEWKHTLEAWRTFLRMPESLESIVEVDL